MLAFELPFLELFELLGEFELFLAIGAVFIIFFTEELVETQQLLTPTEGKNIRKRLFNQIQLKTEKEIDHDTFGENRKSHYSHRSTRNHGRYGISRTVLALEHPLVLEY